MRLAVRYGVWLLLGVEVLVWELLGVKNFRRWLSLGARDHVSLSELVWSVERRWPRAGRVAVAVVLVDLAAHFLAHTALIPGA